MAETSAELEPTDELHGLASRYWELQLRTQPLAATLLGEHEHDHLLPDLSAEAEQDQRRDLDALQNELAALSPGLTHQPERVTAELLAHQLRVGITAIDLRLGELASDHMMGPHAELLMVASQLGYPDPTAAEAAIERYAGVPRLLDQALDRFRQGRDSGRTPASAVLARSINTIDAYLDSPVEADPFTAAGLDPEWSGVDAWRARVETLVVDEIRPAFGRYRGSLADEIAPFARDDDHAGWCAMADGEALYAAMISAHTTTEHSPLELYELGRRLCEEDLPAEFRALGPDAVGTDDLDEIFTRLRNDPSLRHTDAEQIVRVARETVQRATTEMGSWFATLPDSPCNVEPVPAFLAADAPYAYYFPPATDRSRPGTYFINTSDPTGSSATEAESIAFHEAIPGHHLQIAISQELAGIPEFQRHDGATSYVEGWGLYAERLADEMGLYSGPIDRLGMLTADAWRSARLVVDTGLHALGWWRQQAIDYFTSATPVPLDQIASEVDRYLAMPGQALAYKVGQIEIQRLRTEAERRMGERFDVAGFHDVVLLSGAVTLPVLGWLVEDWIRDPSG